jgi:hypothetical protein
MESIKQDEAPQTTQYGVPGGWIDSPQREQPVRLNLMTPRLPTRINDSPEPKTPVRLIDTLPKSPDHLEPEDSPSKQLFEEVNQLSISPDTADDINDILNKLKHSISADFLVDNIIKGKQQRRAPQNVYASA